MASSFKVCLTAVGEPRHIVEIEPDDSIQTLYDLAGETFGKVCVDLKSGFPPKSLDKSVTVRSLLIMNDRVTAILAETKSKPANHTRNPPPEESVQSEPTGRRSQRAAAKVATESFADVVKAQEKLLKAQTNNGKRKRTSTSATTSPSTASSSASRKLAKLPGRRLGDGVEIRPQQATPSSRRTTGPKFHNTEDVSFALIHALESGGGGKVGQVLRGAMRSAISRQYDVSRAVTRVSAVLAGKYSIVEKSGSLVVKFDKGLEGRGDWHETVDAIPRQALEMVLTGIHASDPESLRGAMLAQLSPRVFWSLLKETSPHGRSTDVALQELLPHLDWTFLRRRKQTLSEKAMENLRQATAAEEQETDFEAAAEAIQAVENAMEQLHQYDQSQRRSRAADAASARQAQHKVADEWQLVTPTEVDEDELYECTGAHSEFVSKLLKRGIHNWRQLANADSKEIADHLQIEEVTVDTWIDYAQQESIEEIIVEVCDNRIDVVEILRTHAHTGTPKDLANWRSMPDLLFQTAQSDLEGLGVSADDVATWCQRAHDLMHEYEWMSWYATPVE